MRSEAVSGHLGRRIFSLVRTPGDPIAVELEAGPDDMEAAGLSAAVVSPRG
jgi:hypothetical protein